MPEAPCALCGDVPPGVRGWCPACGYFYDEHGMRLLDVTVKCRVHPVITNSCPHSGSLDWPLD